MIDPKFTRRDFLKLAGAGAATTAVLTGCGPASRYVVREPYAKMPEYTLNGESTYYATTCMECSAGCGLVVRTFQGRAIKVEGNPNHPVNLGKTCVRGQATLHGLYNPDRIQFPISQKRKDTLSQEQITWETGIGIVSDALTNYKPNEIAFLLGETHDHLFDLVSELASAIGAPAPVRFGALSLFEGRHTLKLAVEEFFGQSNNLFFDLGNSDMVVSFGANFLETWISPVAFTRQYSNLRKAGANEKRGYLVQFESRMSQTAAVADEWIPIIPGTETFAALALGRLAAEAKGSLPEYYVDVDAAKLADKAGVDFEKLKAIASRFSDAEFPLAIPGSWALGQKSGVTNAKSILALNQLAENFGKPGGVFFAAEPEIIDASTSFSNMTEVETLVSKLNSGDTKVIFIHGVNPLFELPKSFGFEEALGNADLVISFSTFPDETAMKSDYILPDHAGLESWGYQHVRAGTEKSTLSGSQPVVVPYYDTRSTADVILASAKVVGGKVQETLPYEDEVAYIQSKLSSLLGKDNSLIRAGEIKTFSAQFQQFGGWWSQDPKTSSPLSPTTLNINAEEPEYQGDGEFFLVPFISPILADKGANKPWLQEIPDPTTTVMWNTWVEINPHTAEELGIQDDDIVKIISEAGEVEASVYRYPGIRPDTIGIPFGQGHTAFGRYAKGRGANPASLLQKTINDAGDLVFATTKVKLQRTGEHKQLARLESRLGVYGTED